MQEINDKNIAFIDGQNLYLGTLSSEEAWEVDLKRFRFYLERKYNVTKAYYYIGHSNDDMSPLYKSIQESGFILVFKLHNVNLLSKKKGNIDTDLVFDVMENMYKAKDSFDKIILVSGDGDYVRMVRFLIAENKFLKVLFPNQNRSSSLYKKLTKKYFDDLSVIKNKIGKRKGDLR